MKSSKHIKSLIGFLCIIIMVITVGCLGVKVPLSNYDPMVSGDYSVYRGKRVYLMNFDNQANDTSIWRYYSVDQKFSYSINNAIHNYFWHAFRDVFVKLGMLVSDVDNPDLHAPAMWITLLSITDEKYHVRLTVQERGLTVYTENFTIQEPPLVEKDRNPAALEQRAYRMTNRLIAAILEDPEVRKLLTKP